MRLLVVILTLAVVTPVHAFTARDMRGHEVTLPAAPQRIVSLVPSATEAIFSIGGDTRLVGVTQFCDWPPAARLKPRVGGMIHPSLEAIVALRPDLVIATDEGNSQATLEQLRRVGVPIFVVQGHRLSDVMALVARMGELTARSAAVTPIVNRLTQRIRRVAEAVRRYSRPRVLYVLWPDPIIVPGREALVTELIDLAGGSSVTATARGTYPRLSLEAVVEDRPEVIFLARHGGERTPTLQAAWDRLGMVPAIRTGRVHAVDGNLLHRYGPRVVEGLEALARHLHPEARL
jgi:iron complex transport system substrate-binding protein